MKQECYSVDRDVRLGGQRVESNGYLGGETLHISPLFNTIDISQYAMEYTHPNVLHII
jgi:hypothetical protein